ncbi:MAG: protoporphyrinogen oxidase [Deltaproteobacteria bacterium]
MRIIVIGGGIAGLSAANRLLELGRESKSPIEITLFESANRLGGVISTKFSGGFLIEEGPDSFLTTKPWALNQCRSIGLDSELIPTQSEFRRAFVLRKGTLHPLPEGFFMMAPSRIIPFLRSPLFSWKGKMRVLLDLIIPPSPRGDDESLASFVRRRLGAEALRRVAEPMIAGIYTASSENLSLRATMPQFLEMEERHGSVIRGVRRAMEERKSNDGGARYSQFVSFRGGMQTLPDRLASLLPEGSVRLGEKVESLRNSGGRWIALTDTGGELQADGAIIAAPSHVAAALAEGFDPSLAGDLSLIERASSAVISLAYSRDAIAHPLDGFGFVVPTEERIPIIASSFSSIKFEGRAKEGFTLLRAFVGGAAQEGIYNKTDSEIIGISERELARILRIASSPLLALVHRHPKSMPQYRVGHLKLVERIMRRAATHRGLALAGNAYGGVGVPDCVRSGEQAAESVFKTLFRSE